MAALRGGVLEHEKYPAQMLEVAGDLRRAPAKFENPAPFKARLPVTPSATAWGKSWLNP